MKIKDVLFKNELMLLEKFVKDKAEFEAVKKALLLSFYFNKAEIENLKRGFSEIEEITNKEKPDKNKGKNPAR